MDADMIADMMNIVPIRVWVFWVFIIQAVTLWVAYKMYSNIRRDIVKLAKFLIGGSHK